MPVAGQRSPSVLSKATFRAARHLGLSGAELSKVVGLNVKTVSCLDQGKWDVSPDTKESRRAAQLVRLFCSLDALVVGDPSKVSAWMGLYNRALDGIPRELIQSPQGLLTTLDYLDAMRATS